MALGTAEVGEDEEGNSADSLDDSILRDEEDAGAFLDSDSDAASEFQGCGRYTQ